MLRCITVDKKTLIASNSEKENVKKLSREKQLFCPNCQSTVIFKSGKVKRAHFAHYDSECVVTNYERETASHLKGKQVLYEWLKKTFPSADVEYEVYIPETNQIADIFVEHTEEGMEGIRWSFEFQHSPLSTTEWETRHELYKAEGIQDFWILDKAKYMKFSKAKDITDARIRNELERTIYSNTGLCYFLDLESSELTIDFNFTTSWHTTIVKGVKRQNEYTYHDPIQHSTHIDQVRVRMNDEFMYGVLIYSEIESRMEEQLKWVLAILRGEREKKLEQELQEKAKEKKLFALRKYGEEQTEIIWRFMKSNRDELTDDVRQLSVEEFFDQYEPLFVKLQMNIGEYNKLKESEELVYRLIGSFIYEMDLFSLTFLSAQGSLSLEEYLRIIHQEKINVVTYVYHTYKNDLEKLASMNFRAIKKDLAKIKPNITPGGSNPTAIDYALEYRRLETSASADEHMKKVKEQIIYYNPFSNMMDW